MRNKLAPNLLALWLSLAAVSPAAALQNSWTGAGGDMLWTNSANWSLGVLPDSTQDVLIDNTGTNAVVLNASAEAANFSLGSNAVLNLAGDIAVENSATIDGTLDWVSGTYSVIIQTVVSPSGTWIIRSTAPATLRGTNVNNGTISCFATNLAGAGPQAQITNGHLFVINTSLTLDASLSHDAGFLNTGTLLVPAGNSNLTLAVACGFGSTGTVRVETNSSLTIRQVTAESLWFGSGTVFDGEGLIRLTDGSSSLLNTIVCSGSMTVNGTVELGNGRVFGVQGGVYEGVSYPMTSWSGSGLLRWPSGSLIYFIFATNFNVEITGTNNKAFAGACTNYGKIRWGSNAVWSKAIHPPEANFHNQGEFVLEANCTIEAPFSNSGTLKVPAGRGEVTLVGLAFENSGPLVAETNSVFGLVGIGAQLNPGTVFDGAGVVRFLPGSEYDFYVAGNMVVNGTVEVAGASLHVVGEWTGPGLLRWTSGRLGLGNFGTNFNVEISGAGTKRLTGACTNLGTIRWMSPGPIQGAGPFPGAALNNLGLLILETNCAMVQCGFNNEGIIKVPADCGVVALANYNREIFNSGVVRVETNSILELSVYLNLTEGTVFEGSGVFRFINGESSAQGVNMMVNGAVELAGGALRYGSWSGPGAFRWLGGDFGGFTIAPNFHVEVSGPDLKKLGGMCTNLGSFHVQGSSLNAGGDWSEAVFYNAGLFTADGVGAWNNGSLVNLAAGIFRQTNGQFSVGSIDNAGTMDVMGELNISGQFTNAGYMELSGELNVGGQGYNAGDIKLNGKLNAPDGFQQYPSGSCEMLLHEDPTETQIHANYIVLGGSLTASFADGFTPTNGSVFTVVTNYYQRWDQFSTVTLPPLPGGMTWRVSYQPQTVALIVTSPTSMTNATLLPNGSFQFTLTGSAGGTYEIQASTNLVDWVMMTNAPFAGAATFTDTAATNFTRRFYRGLIHE